MAGRRRAGLTALGLVVFAGLAACAPTAQPAPKGLATHVDQRRDDRNGRRAMFVFTNDTGSSFTLTRLKLTSPRLEKPVTWSGTAQVGTGFGDPVLFAAPHGLCGAKDSYTAEIEYTQNGHGYRSTVHPDDPYHAFTDVLDRDCAEDTFADAATTTFGTPTVTGPERDAVWSVPVTFTPTGKRDDVVFNGFYGTLMWDLRPQTPQDATIPLTGEPVTVDLAVTMNRCDPHMLAENKVGMLVDVFVSSRDLDHAWFDIDWPADVKANLLQFYKDRCTF